MMSPSRLSDQEMVKACLSQSATEQNWDRLFKRCHAHLLRVVRRELRAESANEDLAQEVVQNLWFTLSARRQELLGPFDPTRGTIQAYLGKLARRHTHWDYQHRRRGKKREVNLWEIPEEKIAVTELPRGALEQEFLECLTAEERDFFLYELHGEPNPEPRPPRSDASRWHLQERVLNKWLAYRQPDHGEKNSRK